MEYNKKRVYTEEQVVFVRELVEKGSEVTPATRLMCEKFSLIFDDTIGRSFRNKMQKSGVTNNVVTIEDTDVFKEAQNKQHDNTKKRFLISWAQSETDVHKGFLKNIEAYAEHIDAEILIIAGRYRSPTSLSASKSLEAKEKNVANTWDKSILPYLDANRHNIHKHLVVLSDVKIQPTASNPLSSLNGLTKAESCIVGSPRVHLKSLPVLDGYPNKLLLTTGAITVENYTDSKIGKLGEFHHQLAFIIVELDGDDFHIRQVVADDKGNFYDLIYRLKNGVCLNNEKGVEAIVLGDLHLPNEEKGAVKVSLEIIDRFKPQHVVLHDISDMCSISHHEKRNPFLLLQRENDGSNSLQKELDYMIDWFKSKTHINFIIPSANHSDFLEKWLQNEDWRKENNKSLYLEFANITAKGLAPKGIIAYLLEKEYSNIKCLSVDESYKVLDFELSVHGNIGASGSRGSAIQYKNLNVKLVTAHTHSSSRLDNHLCAGTLTKLRMGYNIGMSSWIASNVVIYPDGKASHIHIVNNKYTTLF
jgi:hypothetical protein